MLKKNHARRILLLLIPVLCVGIGVFLFFSPFIPKNEEVSPTTLRWSVPPNIFVIDPYTQDKKSGVMLVRAADGKQQFVKGGWDVFFTRGANMFLVENKKEKQQIYYILGGEKIQPITITNYPGTIISADENPLTTYIAFVIQREGGSSLCLIERLALEPSCSVISLNKATKARWNPEKDHELIIQTDDGGLYRFDPWEKNLHNIPQKDERFASLLSLLEQEKPEQGMGPLQTQDTAVRILSVLLVKKNKQWGIYSVPPFSRVSTLSGSDHFLIKDRGHLSVLETSSRKIARLITFDNYPQTVESNVHYMRGSVDYFIH